MGIKERFIQETLEQEGARLLRNQGTAIETAYQRRSGRLMGGRSVAVGDAKLTFTHPIYERFLDIGGGKRRRIHNRFVFGTYGAIARRLMYGFTEEVAAEIARKFPAEV